MGLKSTLSDKKKGLILGHIKSGKLSLRQIARLEGVNASTVYRIKIKYESGANVFENKHHLAGRKKKLPQEPIGK